MRARPCARVAAAVLLLAASFACNDGKFSGDKSERQAGQTTELKGKPAGEGGDRPSDASEGLPDYELVQPGAVTVQGSSGAASAVGKAGAIKATPAQTKASSTVACVAQLKGRTDAQGYDVAAAEATSVAVSTDGGFRASLGSTAYADDAVVAFRLGACPSKLAELVDAGSGAIAARFAEGSVFGHLADMKPSSLPRSLVGFHINAYNGGSMAVSFMLRSTESDQVGIYDFYQAGTYLGTTRLTMQGDGLDVTYTDANGAYNASGHGSSTGDQFTWSIDSVVEHGDGQFEGHSE